MAEAAAGREVGSGPWCEHVGRGLLYLIVQLAQRRDIIENPERAPMCSRDEIAIFDEEVVDGNSGQVQLQGVPVFAIVGRDVDAGLRPRVEQPTPSGTSADHAATVIVR